MMQMSRDEVYQKCVQVLHETFDIPRERIALSADLKNDLDLDSIDAVDLIVRMKPMVGKRLTPEAFMQVRTVQDVVDALHRLINDASIGADTAPREDAA
jgi:acyl carrier protein